MSDRGQITTAVNAKIREFVSAVANQSDPTKRALAAGALLAAVPDLQATARKIRQEAVLEMHTDMQSWADVGTALDIDRTRAFQIARGRTSGGTPAAGTE